MSGVDGPRLVSLDGVAPQLHPTSWVAPGATVIGDVVLGASASVWYGTVVRADDAPVRVGRESNLQDGVVVHADPGYPTEIGERVTVGHSAVVHGSVVEDDCIVGMGAVLLNGCRVGRGSVVAAGAVLREGTEVPPGSLVAGVPAAVRRSLDDEGARLIRESAAEYVAQAERYRRLGGGHDDD